MLVMMEAAKSAREDLKAIMGELAGKRAAEPGSTAGLVASNAHAADAVGLRDVLGAAAAGKAAAGEATAESSRASRDSLTDLSSIDSMELQRLMERRAKVFETLSNVLKKISETSSQITGNLK